MDQAAMAAMNAGQYAQAEADARKSLSVGQDSGIAQEVLAAALDAQGKTWEALQAYKVIDDTRNYDPANQFPYALLLLKTGHWAQAVAAYNKALPLIGDGDLMRANSRFSPDVPQPRALAAALHTGLGLTESWLGYTWRGYDKAQMGDQLRAQTLTQFKQAHALAPDSAVVNYYYGVALRRAGHAQEAQAAFKKAAAQGDRAVQAAATQRIKEVL